MADVRLDLNHPEFLNDLFALEREELLAALGTLRKIHRMDWADVYRDAGLKWEAIQTRRGPTGQRVYSLRITRRVRAVAFREGNMLCLLAIHADHDSAYKK
jgi:hypothetical protein